MLIEFTVGNYLSIKDKKTLSMEATAIKENPENIIEIGKYKLLRSAVIYGANSSGKSNFIKAIEKMFELVNDSAKYSSTDEINITPFLLSTETEKEPSHFEILFLAEGIRYRYGFEADSKKIHAEWLYESKINKENLLFIRDKDVIEVSTNYVEGKGLEEKTRDNALFLSIVDQFNGIISKRIMEWFDYHIIFSGIDHEKRKGLTSIFIDESNKGVNKKKWIRDFLTPLSLGFQDFDLVKTNDDNDKIITYHNKYNKEGKIVGIHEFDLLKQESAGTNKLYDMAGSLIATLRLGGPTIIDELDAKLHPLLTVAIVKLFHFPEHNKKNAQLIFATHDTNLLNNGLFRRDQIYFTEKDHFEATDLYSLVEYREPDGKKIRNDRSFEKDYIEGRYGAIPYIGDFSKLGQDGESR